MRSLTGICTSFGEVVAISTLEAARVRLAEALGFASFLMSVDSGDENSLGLLDLAPARTRPPTVVVCAEPSAAMINSVFVRGASLICRSAAMQVLPGYLREVAQRRLIRDHHDTIRRLQERNGLTPRETTILQLAVEGVDRAKIATSLGISEGTAKWHIRSLLSKCEARSLVELSCNVLRSDEDTSATAHERGD